MQKCFYNKLINPDDYQSTIDYMISFPGYLLQSSFTIFLQMYDIFVTFTILADLNFVKRLRGV